MRTLRRRSVALLAVLVLVVSTLVSPGGGLVGAPVAGADAITNPCNGTGGGPTGETTVKRVIVVQLENMNNYQFAHDLTGTVGGNAVGALEQNPTTGLGGYCDWISNASGATHSSLANYVFAFTGETVASAPDTDVACLEQSFDPAHPCYDPFVDLLKYQGTLNGSFDHGRVYAEGMPSNCDATDNLATKYVVHHNPVPYLTGTGGLGPTCSTTDVPFGTWAPGTAGGTGNFYNDLTTDPGAAQPPVGSGGPTFMYVVPNTTNDGSSCTSGVAGNAACQGAGDFVSNVVNAVAASPYYSETALVITADEGHGGNAGGATGQDCLASPSYYAAGTSGGLGAPIYKANGWCNVPFVVVSPFSNNATTGQAVSVPSSFATGGSGTIPFNPYSLTQAANLMLHNSVWGVGAFSYVASSPPLLYTPGVGGLDYFHTYSAW